MVSVAGLGERGLKQTKLDMLAAQKQHFVLAGVINLPSVFNVIDSFFAKLFSCFYQC